MTGEAMPGNLIPIRQNECSFEFSVVLDDFPLLYFLGGSFSLSLSLSCDQGRLGLSRCLPGNFRFLLWALEKFRHFQPSKQ